MNNRQIRHRYFSYVTLSTFTQNLFFTFGALLIFSKTHTIIGVLVYNLVGDITSVAVKGLGFGMLGRSMRRLGFIPVMIAGLFLNIGAYAAIFSLTNHTPYFYPLLLLAAIIGNIGSATYNVCGTTLMLRVIGSSSAPGLSAAQIDSLKIFSGLLAVGAAVIFNHYGLFNLSFLAGALMLLLSVIPLYRIPAPSLPEISFRETIKKIPRPMLWANFNPDHEISVTALPLVILLLSASLRLSININAIIAVFSIVLAYLAGTLKDRNRTWLVWVALAVGVASWSAYAFVTTPLGFIVPGVLVWISMGILTLYREARMGPFMEQTKNFLGATFAIEFMRSLGGLAATVLIVLAYLIFRTLPKEFLAISWVFLIPLALYGAGKYLHAPSPT
jgi:hypothetical protein